MFKFVVAFDNAGMIARTLRQTALLLILLLTFLQAGATHNRAGEITYKQKGQFTYEVTLTTYTDSRSTPADRPKVDIEWGDNNTSEISRTSQTLAGNYTNTFINVYTATHTYPGPGNFIIRFEDPNRIAGINNMANSVTTSFYVESQLQISPSLGFNQSPVLLQPPIDNAKLFSKYYHNPNAYDPDGDSIVFKLVPPKKDVGQNVSGYFTPESDSGFTLNPSTGELIWNSPQRTGIYNIAILVTEYRHKIQIGYITRDMQIIVEVGTNLPPRIMPMKDTCLEAGKHDTLVVDIKAKDPNTKNVITITASGGPFILNPKAYLSPGDPHGHDSVSATFNWTIDCAHIRRQPYRVVFRAVDDDPLLPLSDIKHFDIKVVGPAPDPLQVSAFGSTITLLWTKPVCEPIGYFVYRKIDSSHWKHDYCETGVPPFTGFQILDTVLDPNILTFMDKGGEDGLSPGVSYCYRVTAIYLNDGQFDFVEGYASNEVCVKLKKDVPVITNVSVRNTDQRKGSMYVAWSRPNDLDTTQNPGPYSYRLIASQGNGAGPQTRTVITAPQFYQLKDSTYIDSGLNTVSLDYLYRVEFYNSKDTAPVFIGKSLNAKSIYLNIERKHLKLHLRWSVKVPWKNSEYVIYRKINNAPDFDSLTTTKEKEYIDTGLTLGVSYCYKIKSIGKYSSTGFVNPIINYSEVFCAAPKDTIPPCPPLLTASTDCDARQSSLNWSIPDIVCNEDVVKYKVYFSYRRENKFKPVDSLNNAHIFAYKDTSAALKENLAGCYAVTAIDSFGNESPLSNQPCVDNCPRYSLPNVFTPSGDGINDLYMPLGDYRFIESIDLRIFNRWGQEIFHTNDPAIKWDGLDKQFKTPLPAGPYFFTCIVYELYLDEVKKGQVIRGTITILR